MVCRWSEVGVWTSQGGPWGCKLVRGVTKRGGNGQNNGGKLTVVVRDARITQTAAPYSIRPSSSTTGVPIVRCGRTLESRMMLPSFPSAPRAYSSPSPLLYPSFPVRSRSGLTTPSGRTTESGSLARAMAGRSSILNSRVQPLRCSVDRKER